MATLPRRLAIVRFSGAKEHRDDATLPLLSVELPDEREVALDECNTGTGCSDSGLGGGFGFLLALFGSSASAHSSGSKTSAMCRRCPYFPDLGAGGFSARGVAGFVSAILLARQELQKSPRPTHTHTRPCHPPQHAPIGAPASSQSTELAAMPPIRRASPLQNDGGPAANQNMSSSAIPSGTVCDISLLSIALNSFTVVSAMACWP